MKKGFALLLVCAVLFGLYAGLAENDDAVTLKMFIAGTRPMNEYTDMTREYVKETIGVDMDLTEIDYANFSQQLALLVSGNEMPDVVYLSFAEWQQYAADGAWADLSAYLNEEDYPNLWKFVPETYWPYLAIDGEGKYGVPNMSGTPTFHSIGIRMDWLEKLGLDVPVTLEDYTEVLRAFTFRDPDGNGENDTYGLSCQGSGYLAPLFGSFGATYGQQYLLNDDGTITTNAISEAYKDALQYIHSLYKEGLIDPEIFTITYDQVITKWARGEFGIWPCWYTHCGNAYSRFDMAGLQPDSVVDIILPPVGETGLSGMCAADAFSNVVGISYLCDEEKIQAVLKLLDFNASSYGWRVLKWGVEGEFFTYDKDTDMLTWKWNVPRGEDKVLTTMSGYSISDMEVYCLLYNENLQAQGNKIGQNMNHKLNYKGVEIRANESTRENVFALISSDELSTYVTDLNNYFTQSQIAFITGEKDINEGWDEYVNTYLSMGAEEVRQSLLAKYNDIMGKNCTFAE